MSKFDFVYQAPPIGLLAPAADGGGRTGPYKHLRGVCSGITLVCRVNQGNAAQVTFTPLQAKDNAGTGSKPTPGGICLLQRRLHGLRHARHADAGGELPDGCNAQGQIRRLPVRTGGELDLANGFNHIAIQTSASNAANITEAFMLAVGRFQQAVPMASEV